MNGIMKTNMEQVQSQNQHNMTVDYFMKTFLKIIKAMKSDIYLIMNNIILGTNKDSSYISECTGLYNGIPDNTFIEISKDIIMELSKSPEQFKGNNAYTLLYNLSSKIVPDYYIENLRENEKFNEILTYKAADGAASFNITDSDTIFIYPSLLGVNKADEISAAYYKFGYPDNYDICKFMINKKFITVNKYIAYLPVN